MLGPHVLHLHLADHRQDVVLEPAVIVLPVDAEIAALGDPDLREAANGRILDRATTASVNLLLLALGQPLRVALTARVADLELGGLGDALALDPVDDPPDVAAGIGEGHGYLPSFATASASALTTQLEVVRRSVLAARSMAMRRSGGTWTEMRLRLVLVLGVIRPIMSDIRRPGQRELPGQSASHGVDLVVGQFTSLIAPHEPLEVSPSDDELAT